MKAKACLILGALTLAALPSGALAAVVFSSDMSSGAAWTVNGTADTLAIFGYDYSADGIPAAPNGSGTLGLKMSANLAAASVDEVIATPTGLVLTGNHKMSVDIWMNYKFGDGASTQFAGGGLGYNGTATTRNGAMVLADGDGGSTRDYRGYKNTGEQFAESGQFYAGLSSAGGGAHQNTDPYYASTFPGGLSAPAIQGQVGTTPVGTPSFAWHTWEFIGVNNPGDAHVIVKIDGLPIAKIDSQVGSAVATTGNAALIFSDLFTSVAPDGALYQFAIYDNVVIEDVPEPATLSLLALGGLAVLRRRR